MKKKILLALCLVFVCFSLAACEPRVYKRDYEQMKSDIESVELLFYKDENCKKVEPKVRNIRSFDDEKAVVLETMPSEKIDGYLKELCGHYGWLDSNTDYLDTPSGLCIRFIYTNGNFEIHSCIWLHSCLYDANGNPIEILPDWLEPNSKEGTSFMISIFYRIICE